MFNVNNKEAEKAKTIKWDYVEGNIVRFYDTEIQGITKDLFKSFEFALNNRQIDVIKPIALLVNQNAAVSRTKTRSPFFSVIQAATEEGRTYWMDTQYLANRLMSKGVMTKHSHFTTDYASLSNFYIANNTRDFIFGLDIDMNYKYTDILGNKGITNLMYVVGVKHSHIRDVNGNDELANLATIKTILEEFKFGVMQRKEYHFEGANLVPNGDKFGAPQLIKDLDTMVAIPLPEANYMPKLDIYYDNDDVYLYASSTVNASLFMYEYMLNTDVQDDFSNHVYKIETGFNDFGNNIFNDNIWTPTEEDKKIDIIENNKDYLDSLKQQKQEGIVDSKPDEDNISVEEPSFTDDAIKQMRNLGGLEENDDSIFDEIMDSIGDE